MTAAPALETRAATPADEAPLRAALGEPLASALARTTTAVLICTPPNGAILAGVAIRTGQGPEPTPAIEQLRLAAGLDETTARRASRELLLAAERLVRGRDAATWVLTLEATAHAPIRAAEGLGYRPTGRGPYREIGPGVVEYLHGYTGPEGFLVDFEPAR